MIDDKAMRKANIYDQLDNLIKYYTVYFFFVLALTIQLTFCPNDTFPFALLILTFYHVLRVYTHFRKLTNTKLL